MTDTKRASEIVRRFEAGESPQNIASRVFSPPRTWAWKEREQVLAVLRAELKRRTDALQEVQDLVMKVFSKWGFMFDENPAPTYIDVQAYLIRIGRVRPEECVKP